jgi:hypothetical protein
MSAVGRGQLFDDELEPLDGVVVDDEPLDDALLDALAESLDDEVADVVASELDEPASFESFEADVDAEGFLPRLSVLKNPEPLKVTPTGVKTFLTGRTSPVSGWAIAVRFSSWKPCWTSMVSPVSTNL